MEVWEGEVVDAEEGLSNVSRDRRLFASLRICGLRYCNRVEAFRAVCALVDDRGLSGCEGIGLLKKAML